MALIAMEPDRLIDLVRDWAANRCATGVAIVRLLAQSSDVPAACRALASLESGPDGAAARALRASLEGTPGAERAARLLARARRDLDATGADAVERARVFFDWAAREDPELGVAAYALEGPRALGAATGEIVDWLDARGALAGRRAALDLGCGTGRIARALAPRCEEVVGIDVSGAMIAHARSACADLPGVAFLEHDGRSVLPFPAARFDLVVAVDVFPYLVQQESTEGYVAEIARVLRPSGDVFVFHWSYRGDDERDRREARSAFERRGLEVLACGDRPLRSWDAAVLHARSSAARDPGGISGRR